MPAGDPFGDMMNAPKKYVVSKTLTEPKWRNTTIIRDNVIESVHALKAEPGKTIMTDGSSQLVHALLANDLVDELRLLLYPLTLGSGKRLMPAGAVRDVQFEIRDAVSDGGGGAALRPHRVRGRATAYRMKIGQASTRF